MNRKVIFFLGLVLFSIIIAAPSFSAETKLQMIDVIIISHVDISTCGSHAGSIDAIYKGQKIRIDFYFNPNPANPIKNPVQVFKDDRIVREWDRYLCATSGTPALLAGKRVTVQGLWGKNKTFTAYKLFIRTREIENEPQATYSEAMPHSDIPGQSQGQMQQQEYVFDPIGIIPGYYKMRLNKYLKELEMKTSAQVVVLTILSLDGENIDQFAQRTFAKMKLGQKGKDNGLLVVVAYKDRKYRFHTGHGLENILPDSHLAEIGRQYFVPYFKKGDYGAGIYQGTMAAARTIANAQGVQITEMQ